MRQQRHDMGLLVEFMRDLNSRQSQLFFLIATFLARYKPDELQSLVDEDVAEAAGTLAATFETAARGVIYEHPAASIPAGRLATALRAALNEAEQGGGSPFQRDAALILRRVEDAARKVRGADATNPRALLRLLERVIQKTGEAPHELPGEPRLIVP
jgi:hypothetical protein